MLNKISRYSRIITTPIIKEFPFFISYIIILSAHAIYYNWLAQYISRWGVIDLTPIIKTIFSTTLQAYILAAIINAIRIEGGKRAIRTIFYIATILLFACNDFLFKNFGAYINATYFILLAETTKNESSEFINQYILSSAIIPTLLKALAMVALTVTINKFWPFVKNLLKKIPSIKNVSTFITILVIALSMGYTAQTAIKVCNATNSEDLNYMQNPLDAVSQTITSTISINIMKKNMEQALEFNKQIAQNERTTATLDDTLNIVLVLGESYIKSHSYLYGYPLNTTPNLNIEKREGRLFLFDNAMATTNITSSSIRNILCCNNSSDNEEWYNYPYFPSLFFKAGYDVYFWSNQMTSINSKKKDFTLNGLLYDPDICTNSYTKINDKPFKYDGKLVESFKEEVKISDNKNNLIIFHLMGQHHIANERYPNDKFTHFTADSIKHNKLNLSYDQKEYIAQFDNATLYNDYILKEIIDIFRNTNTVLVYLSDHGDEVYDYQIKRGRDRSPNFTTNKVKYQYDIPFMVWCSDIYKEKHPQTIKSIEEASLRPFSSDNLCHLMFNLGGIQTIHYRDTLDIISPNFKEKRRLINGRYNYEAIRFAQE